MTDVAQSRYSTGAMLFHWTIAVLVIVNWRLAEAGEHAAIDADKAFFWGQHKAVGITILVLSVLRLGWRLMHKPPPMSDLVPKWQRVLGKTVHVIFYVMLIGLPIGGWLTISYYGSDIDYWGLFTIPGLPVEPDMEAGKAIGGQHAAGAKLLLALVALHTLGALKHTFVDKVNGIGRMLPFGRT